MNKEKVFKEEMKGFNVSIDDIELNKDIFGAIEKSIIKMKNDYLMDRLEVILNGNLIECKDKLTNFRTILGCRISYDNLPKDVSFIVRKDEKPTYEELKKEIDRLNNIIEELEKEIISQIEICKEGQVLEAKVRSPFDTYSGDIRAYKYLLYKLKALKEDNNGR